MTANFLILTLTIGAPALKGVKPTLESELTRLTGQWVMVAESVDGEPEYEPPSPALTLICDGRTIYVVRAKGEWTICPDPAVSPKAADLLIYNRGRLNETIRFIYELDGDTLRMATRLFSDERPTSFRGDKERLEVWTFRRAR